MSQFFIIAQTGPVSSTVVGHVKTCSIVALGWITSGRAVGDKSVIGVFIAVGGIITYVNLSSKMAFFTSLYPILFLWQRFKFLPSSNQAFKDLCCFERK
jgi:hypothetical protein